MPATFSQECVSDLPLCREREQALAFYNSPDTERYGRDQMPEAVKLIERVVKTYCLERENAVIVDLGCGRGSLQECHSGYIGLDLSLFALRTFLPGKPRVQADIEELPLANGSVDLVVSFAALEHVPHPERCLAEIDRVLKPGGVAIVAPAWFCRSWAADGLLVKSYRDLSWPNKLRKASIPVFNHLLARSLRVLPQRLMREVSCWLNPKPLGFTYERLKPNLQDHIFTDCDAFVSMDPHAAICYYRSRLYQVPDHETLHKRLLARHAPIVVRKQLL